MVANQFSPKESKTPVFSGNCLLYGQITAMEQPGVLAVMPWGISKESRKAHNPEVGGSNALLV
jgi:hypothetical protein